MIILGAPFAERFLLAVGLTSTNKQIGIAYTPDTLAISNSVITQWCARLGSLGLKPAELGAELGRWKPSTRPRAAYNKWRNGKIWNDVGFFFSATPSFLMRTTSCKTDSGYWKFRIRAVLSVSTATQIQTIFRSPGPGKLPRVGVRESGYLRILFGVSLSENLGIWGPIFARLGRIRKNGTDYLNPTGLATGSYLVCEYYLHFYSIITPYTSIWLQD